MTNHSLNNLFQSDATLSVVKVNGEATCSDMKSEELNSERRKIIEI